MNESTKQELAALAELLEELADLPEEVNFSEVGDWFHSSGSQEVSNVAGRIKRIAERM